MDAKAEIVFEFSSIHDFQPSPHGTQDSNTNPKLPEKNIDGNDL